MDNVPNIGPAFNGLYSRAKTVKRRDLQYAASMKGVDEEIAVLRVKLKHIITRYPDNILLIDRVLASLVRLLRVKQKLGPDESESLKQAIGNVLRDFALPLGFSLPEKIE